MEDVLLAFFDEVLNAVSLKFGFICDVELSFDLVFDGQAVGIPSGFSVDVVSRHRLIAADSIFHDAREDMMHAGRRVRERRSFEEDKGRFCLMHCHAFLEDVVLSPERQSRFLFLCERKLWGYFFKHAKSLSFFSTTLTQNLRDR